MPPSKSSGSQEPRALIIGAGAQAKYALETFRLRSISVCAVMNLTEETGVPWVAAYDQQVIPYDPHFQSAGVTSATHFLVCTPDPEMKRRIADAACECGLLPISAIHPAAVVATTARVGNGTIINAGAVVQPFARVGANVMVHANCVVEHDVTIEDFVNLAPGVRLAGWVRIGEGATVYTGANVIPRVAIGRNSVVAAGATVISDVGDDVLVAGVPAEVRKSLERR